MMQKLNEIPGKNPFKVPENYFEDVNKKIISVTSGNNQEVTKAGLYVRLRPYLLVAASVAGFIILSYSAIKLLTLQKQNSQLTEFIYTDYPETFMNDIDMLTLEESAASLDLFEDLPIIDKTDIIDYLLLDNIEINDIYEHL